MYQAKNAARNPNTAPAFCNFTFGVPPVIFGVSMYERASRRNVIQNQKKSAQKTTVDLTVRSQKRKVIMNQPCKFVSLVEAMELEEKCI
jgi:hypothetical protein